MEKYKPSADNKQSRLDFIDYWAKYVKTHPDQEWSKEQNILINSVLKTTFQFPREEYLKVKEEKRTSKKQQSTPH